MTFRSVAEGFKRGGGGGVLDHGPFTLKNRIVISCFSFQLLKSQPQISKLESHFFAYVIKRLADISHGILALHKYHHTCKLLCQSLVSPPLSDFLPNVCYLQRRKSNAGSLSTHKIQFHDKRRKRYSNFLAYVQRNQARLAKNKDPRSNSF